MQPFYSIGNLKMKYNPAVSSDRRKARKRHFTAPSSERRVIMSATLSKQLRKTHNIRSLPIRKGDEIMIMRGGFKGREGKVKTVYRRRWIIHLEKITREKTNGSSVPVGFDPSNVMITKLHMDKDRQALIDRKTKAKNASADKAVASQ